MAHRREEAALQTISLLGSLPCAYCLIVEKDAESASLM